MTRDALIEFCLSLPFAYEDYPFDKGPEDKRWTVMRHRHNKKSFALIYTRGGALCVNLKCDPLEADFLRQTFRSVSPGFHMNKTHWNTITLGGDVPEAELKRQIQHSHRLIEPKKKNSQHPT